MPTYDHVTQRWKARIRTQVDGYERDEKAAHVDVATGFEFSTREDAEAAEQAMEAVVSAALQALGACTCEHCGGSRPVKARFCSARCKARYHREHEPLGVVKAARRLMKGRASVIVHYGAHEAERAMHFAPGEEVVLASAAED